MIFLNLVVGMIEGVIAHLSHQLFANDCRFLYEATVAL